MSRTGNGDAQTILGEVGHGLVATERFNDGQLQS